jgi:hypothetical protein
LTRLKAGAAAALMLAAGALLTPSCGKPSDEILIRELLAETVAKAEKKDIAGMMGSFAPEYVDFQGRDVAGTLRLVTGYLDGYRHIVIHLLGILIADIGPDGRASVECEVALSHGAAEALRRLIRYTGEYYRFEIDLRKSETGEWLFTRTAWESVGLAGLFPESLDVLKELFPGF